jgi:hypothetical protein
MRARGHQRPGAVTQTKPPLPGKMSSLQQTSRRKARRGQEEAEKAVAVKHKRRCGTGTLARDSGSGFGYLKENELVGSLNGLLGRVVLTIPGVAALPWHQRPSNKRAELTVTVGSGTVLS